MRTIAIVLALSALCVPLAALDWFQTTGLPRSSWRHACAEANGFIYFIGGGTGPESDCWFSRVNPDGSLGAWNQTTSIPTALGWLSADATSNHIYICGGWNSGLTSAVSFASLDTSGAVGTWQSGTSLPTQLYTHGAIIVDSCLYVIGGATGVGQPVIQDVRFARIQPDGSLGAWASTSSLPQPLRIMGVACSDSFLYAVGGRNAEGNSSALTHFCRRNPDGTLEPWQGTTYLPRALDGLTCAIVAGRIYAVAGISSGVDNDVYSAPLNPDGSIGTWQTETSLPAYRWAADGLAVNGRIYVPGGWLNEPHPEVYYSSLLTGVATGPEPARPARLEVVPSVSRGPVSVRLSGTRAASTLTVLDASGRTWFSQELDPGAVSANLRLPRLPAGSYFCLVSGGNPACFVQLP